MASPLLMLPLSQENVHQQEITTRNICLFSLKTKKPCKLMDNFLQENLQCVGSSHGWLALLDRKAADSIFLLNPFSGTQIHLPGKHSLPQCIHHGSCDIVKVVLSTTPSVSHDNMNNYAVIVIYQVLWHFKVAFCRNGDQEWRDLESKFETDCYDVVCCDQTNTLFALGPGPCVEAWDLNEVVPKKRMMLQDSCPKKLAEAHENYPGNLYSSQCYLALSSSGQLFLVVRYIGEFVRYDGVVVQEADTLTDYASEPLVCPYRTVNFYVFKFDADEKKWIEVESLNDYALFLGGNHSKMLAIGKENAELKGNAIYFTDDCRGRLNEDYSYGGHDMGIFNLKDGTIHSILDRQQQRIEPPPFWIIY